MRALSKMTFLYWILKQTAPRTGEVYFGDIKLENEDVIPVGKPFIFVANHPSSLMDPIICGGYINVPIHFLGRADIFKGKFISGFLRKSHMWPIYRNVDGKESLSKNEQVFKECYASVKEGNPILLYGEGRTDERFIRRVKKIKKGAARIAMGAEVAYDFELDLKIIPVGINYTNPENFGGDLLIRFAEPISVKEYKELHDENAVKSLLEITNEIERRLLNEVVHINNVEDSEGFEQTLQLFENTMHYVSRDGVPALNERWETSKHIAEVLNEMEQSKKESFFQKVKSFWQKINSEGNELYIIRALNGGKVSSAAELIQLILGFPLALVGLILNFPLFYLLKTLPQKLTKRITFYAGMKVAFGTFLTPILLSLEYLIFSLFIYIPYLYPVILIGGIISGIYAVRYLQVWRRFKRKQCALKRLKSLDQKGLKSEFDALKKEVLR